MKVSVLINNYNYAKYLDYCINSVLNQTYSNIEVILYDDGSTDNSIEIAEKYSDKIEIIKCNNYGKYPSFNQANAIYQAFRISKGEIICLLDSDDAFQENKVELVVEAFKKHTEIVLVQHKFHVINEKNERMGKIYKNIIPVKNICEGIKYTNRLDLFFMQTSALSFRRSYLESVLPLLELDQFKLLWPDVKLSRTSLFYGKIFTFNKPLGEYRLHGLNDSKKLKDKSHNELFHRQLYDFYNQLLEQYGFKYKVHYSNNFLTQLKIVLYCIKSEISFKAKIRFIINRFKR